MTDEQPKPEDAGEPSEDRSEPPPGHAVVQRGPTRWAWGPVLPGHDEPSLVGADMFSRAGAVQLSWRHYDVVTAPVREQAAAAEAELERLRGILAGDATLIHTSYTEGSPLEVALRHPLVLAQVGAMREVLDSCKAENYVEVVFNDTDRDPPQQYLVTYQRMSGKRPAELRKIAEQERDEAQALARHHQEACVSAIAEALKHARERDEARSQVAAARAEGLEVRYLLRCAQHHVPRDWSQCNEFLDRALRALRHSFAHSGDVTLAAPLASAWEPRVGDPVVATVPGKVLRVSTGAVFIETDEGHGSDEDVSVRLWTWTSNVRHKPPVAPDQTIENSEASHGE